MIDYSIIRLRKQEFNPRTGVWERSVKSLNGFTASGSFNTITSSTVLSSTILPSNHNALLTALSVGSDNMASLSVVGSTSGTVFTVTCEDTRTKGQATTLHNQYLAYLAAGETMSLVGVSVGSATSSTLTVFSSFRLEPVLANLETE